MYLKAFTLLAFASGLLSPLVSAAGIAIPKDLQGQPQTPILGNHAANGSYIYLRANTDSIVVTSNEDDIWGYVGLQSLKTTKRLFAGVTAMSQKRSLAYKFQVIVSSGGFFQLLAVTSGPSNPGAEGKKLHFGGDYVDFQPAKDESKYNMWIEPCGRLAFTNAKTVVYRDDRQRSDSFNKLNFQRTGQVLYFYAEPA
ncbi:hypothetical protein F5Y16DRAFT_406505 [Xylariaceae sp. FL0255]|nr:hypothetical protein F5Y16DRAFT_406505 [Xylariaceae sp. FL0255]